VRGVKAVVVVVAAAEAVVGEERESSLRRSEFARVRLVEDGEVEEAEPRKRSEP
jgi:hypothetical protein